LHDISRNKNKIISAPFLLFSQIAEKYF